MEPLQAAPGRYNQGMKEPGTLHVLLMAEDHRLFERLKSAINGPDIRLWFSPAEVPQGSTLDVVVAGGIEVSELALPAGHSPGLIYVDGRDGGDLSLPCDTTDRELQLACRLMAEIARLRRAQHSTAQANQRLAQEALTDPLSGLANRRAWDRELAARLEQLDHAVGWLCLAILDLDHFKRVNDDHGHAVGDTVLRTAAKAIAHGLRSGDFVARLGGDEFGLLLSISEPASAPRIVDRVRGLLPARLAAAGLPSITASAGFALAEAGKPGSTSTDALFIAADAALGGAKRAGRNRTQGAA